IEPDIVVPLAFLRELAAHEQELLSGMAPHVSEISAQIGEALPAVAGHLADQRSLAVHRLVMAEREDEILVKSVKQPKGEIVVWVFTMQGDEQHVLQAIVHPPHFPFEAKPEPADIDRA